MVSKLPKLGHRKNELGEMVSPVGKNSLFTI